LINEFVHVLDDIPKGWVLKNPTPEAMAIAPSAAQVRDILAPWRPLRWRSAAWEIWNQMRGPDWHAYGFNIWLRTHYAAGEEEKAQDGAKLVGWFEESVDDNPNGEDPDEIIAWSILDDESVFNFGDDWERVFEVIPELAGPRAGFSRRFVIEEYNERIIKRSGETLREQVASLPSLQDRIAAVESSDNYAQVHSVDSYIFVADERTFTADELLILFLDKMGNHIRQSRIPLPCHELSYFGGALDRIRLDTAIHWTEDYPPGSTLSTKYRAFGEIGRELYGVDDLLSS
jgi:hypothetical protein